VSFKEVTYYEAQCDWPGFVCGRQTDSEFTAWAEPDSVLDIMTDAEWRTSRDGKSHYCDLHPAIWASDYENGEPFPEPPYLLIHDGDTDDSNDDGRVTYVPERAS